MARLREMNTSILPFMLFAVLLAVPAAARGEDWIALKDGTILPCKVEREEDLAVYLAFEHGTVRVGREHIALLAREKADPFVPRTEEEKKRVEKGQVLFEGTWMSARKRDQIMAKRYKMIRRRIAEAEKHQSWHHAYEIDTRTALIRSNAPKEVLDFYVDRWEAFSRFIVKSWKIKLRPGLKHKKPLICIFKNEADYQKYANPPPGAKGFFSRGRDETLYIYHDRSDMMDTLETLFHEGTHLFVYFIDPTFIYPIWMNEGLAEYMSACTYDGKTFTPGKLQGDRLIPLEEALKSNTLMSVKEMINLPQLSFLARGGYPPAWSFTHFMLENRNYAKKYKEFFLGLGRGKAKLTRGGKKYSTVKPQDLKDYFHRIFRRDIESFQEEWKTHIQHLLDNLDAKSYFFKGQYRLAHGDDQGALSDLKKALDMGLHMPECRYLYGMAAARTGDVQTALDALRKAVDTEPLNGRYTFGLGAVYTNHVPQEREKGLRLLDLALEIEPDNLTLKKQYDYFFSGGKSATGKKDEGDEED